MHDEDLPIVDLQVTDERFGDKVFTGTAESIYNQMRGERPELFANDTEISVEEASLEKRQGTVRSNISHTLRNALITWPLIDHLVQLRVVQQPQRPCGTVLVLPGRT